MTRESGRVDLLSKRGDVKGASVLVGPLRCADHTSCINVSTDMTFPASETSRVRRSNDAYVQFRHAGADHEDVDCRVVIVDQAAYFQAVDVRSPTSRSTRSGRRHAAAAAARRPVGSQETS